MKPEIVTVFCRTFAVPGAIVKRGLLSTVQISYHPPGEARPRTEWFYDHEHQRRPGERMGDHADPPLRYSERRADP